MGTLRRDIATTFSGNFLGTVFLFAVAVVFARVLGPANRGILALALLIPDVTGKIFTFGHETVNSTFAGLYKDNRSSLFQQSLLIVIAGSILSVLVICSFYFWLPVEKGRFAQVTSDVAMLTCLVAPTAMLARLLIALTRGVGRITSAAVTYTAQAASLFVLVSITLLFIDRTVKAAVLVTALAPLISIGVSLWLLRDYVSFNPSRFSGKFFRKGLVFGGQFSLSTIARLLNLRLDQAILAFMVPINQVGLYVIAVGFAERLRLLPGSISVAFLPTLANELKDRQSEVPRVFRCTVIISFASMLLVAVLGIPVILYIFGAEYTGSILSFLLLLPGIAVMGGSSILSSDLAAREKPKYSVINGYATLTVNIILNLLLIPRIGIAGAAVASSVSYTLAGVLWLVFFRHESKVPFKQMIPGPEDFGYILRHLAIVLGLKKFFGK